MLRVRRLARQRYALLRQLQREGINQFGVYRIEAGEMPERYPVFLRNESSHRGPISGLIPDSYSLKAAIDEVLTKGVVPERHLIAVEYAAEPITEGIFAAFRVGDRIVPIPSVHESSWIAKHGERGIAGENLYQEENEQLRANPYHEVLMRAFTTANIEYGRADFGIVGAGVQIYEINTTPRSPTRTPCIPLSIGAIAVLTAGTSMSPPFKQSIGLADPPSPSIPPSSSGGGVV